MVYHMPCFAVPGEAGEQNGVSSRIIAAPRLLYHGFFREQAGGLFFSPFSKIFLPQSPPAGILNPVEGLCRAPERLLGLRLTLRYPLCFLRWKVFLCKILFPCR